MKYLLVIITQILLLAFMASSTMAEKDYSGHHGNHGMHGKHSMDFAQLRDSVEWNSDQMALLDQLEGSHVDLMNLMTNLRASSVGMDGEFDRSLFKEQLAQNSYLMDEHKVLMESFMTTVSDEQIHQWKALHHNCNKVR